MINWPVSTWAKDSTLHNRLVGGEGLGPSIAAIRVSTSASNIKNETYYVRRQRAGRLTSLLGSHF